METLKEIIIIVAFVVILVGAIFIGGRYILNSNYEQSGTSAIDAVNNGEPVNGDIIVSGLNEKNNKKLNAYIEKYDDKTMGFVAYILSRVRIYSIPICVLLFVYGAFLYWVISAKKFVEAERGYGYIVSSIIFLIIAQVAPLAFALISTFGRS